MLMKPQVLTKAVATAGTRERLTDLNRTAPAVTIQAKSGNTGKVYIGNNQVSSTNGFELSAGDSITLDSEVLGLANAIIRLDEIWLDVATSTDGVIALFLTRIIN